MAESNLKEILKPIHSFVKLKDFNSEEKELYNFKKINIFVGENNSGKSRLIREIFKLCNIDFQKYFGHNSNLMADLFKHESDFLSDRITQVIKIQDFETNIKQNFGDFRSFLLNYILNIIEFSDKKKSWISDSNLMVDFFKDYFNFDLNQNNIENTINFLNDELGSHTCIQNSQAKKFANEYINILNVLNDNVIPKLIPQVSSVYIPINRSLIKYNQEFDFFNENLEYQIKKNNSNDFIGNTLNKKYRHLVNSDRELKERFLEDLKEYDFFKTNCFFNYFYTDSKTKKLIFENKNHEVTQGAFTSIIKNNFNIHTGQNFYNELKTHLLGDLEKREIIAQYQKFLKEKFFNNENVVLLPRIDSNYVYIKIGNEEERPIYELGDGIQSIIIITFPLFLNRNKYLKVFIEEPEKYLHPRLQFILLDTLLNQDGFQNFQYFITTHSNHFLDLTLEQESVSIYTVKKENSVCKINNVKNGDKDILSLLGVSNSSVFLSNCTIWVEGIGDRLLIRKYLQAYCSLKNLDDYQENLHYSFIEYAGSNLPHWDFLDENVEAIKTEAINQNIFLLMDNDNYEKNGGEKKKRIEYFKEKLDEENFHILDSREIENTVPQYVYAELIRKENDGQDITDLLNQFDYFKPDIYIGKHIIEFCENNTLTKPSNYFNAEKTISNKAGFAREVEKIIDKKLKEDKESILENVLSAEGMKIAEKTYNFIKKHNQ